jgi:hypothetical protein
VLRVASSSVLQALEFSKLLLQQVKNFDDDVAHLRAAAQSSQPYQAKDDEQQQQELDEDCACTASSMYDNATNGKKKFKILFSVLGDKIELLRVQLEAMLGEQAFIEGGD